MGRFLNQLFGGLNLRGVLGMSVLGYFLIDLGVFGDVGLISSWWVVFGSSVELVWGVVLVNRVVAILLGAVATAPPFRDQSGLTAPC